MRIDPAGWPFVLGGLVLAIIRRRSSPARLFGVVLLGLSAFFLFFFRDPDRAVARAASGVVSPADGRVMVAGHADGQGFPADRWQQISIFLSPMDVHVNRMPVGGRVTKVEYHPGRFLPAYESEAADLNEYTEVVVDHDGHADRGPADCRHSRATHRLPRQGRRRRAGRRSVRRDEVRIADGRLPPAERDAAGRGRARRCVGGVTVLATLARRRRQRRTARHS